MNSPVAEANKKGRLVRSVASIVLATLDFGIAVSEQVPPDLERKKNVSRESCNKIDLQDPTPGGFASFTISASQVTAYSPPACAFDGVEHLAPSSTLFRAPSCTEKSYRRSDSPWFYSIVLSFFVL